MRRRFQGHETEELQNAAEKPSEEDDHPQELRPSRRLRHHSSTEHSNLDDESSTELRGSKNPKSILSGRRKESQKTNTNEDENDLSLLSPLSRSKTSEFPEIDPKTAESDLEESPTKDIHATSKLSKKSWKSTKREESQLQKESRRKSSIASDFEFDNIENMKFINNNNLPKLPKIEADPNGNFMGSSHKFEKPLNSLQIRVRLLKYPSVTEKSKWPGDLAVMDDRIFSWQEKVFSVFEAEKYTDKRNLKTDLDHEYQKEIEENPSSVGAFLHSYVQEDFFVVQQRRKSLVKKHPSASTKSTRIRGGQSEAQYLFGGNGEPIDLTTLVDSGTSGAIVRSRSSVTNTALSDNEREKLAQEQKLEEERCQKEAIRQDALKEKSLEKQRQETEKRLLGWQKKQLEAQQRQDKLKSFIDHEELTKVESLSRFSRVERPTTSILESFSSNKRQSRQKFEEDDEDYGKLRNENSHELKKEKLKLPTVKRPVWQVSIPGRVRFVDRPAMENPSKSMYIMLTLPDMKRRKRELIVCAIKTVGNSGSVILKPPFGYRIIEAKRNQVYRLIWEMYSPINSKEIETKGRLQSIFPSIINDNRKDNERTRLKGRYGLLDHLGGSFEQISLNEMRVFVMGEILSANGFESEPLCVHYLVEVPHGWKSNSNDLQGITHSSYTTDDSTAHFSHAFSFQLIYSMDAVNAPDNFQRPAILFMVVSIKDSGRVRYEGYGYTSLPSEPGAHILRIHLWKPKPRSIVEKLQDTFLDATPSLQDMKAVHIPTIDDNGQKVGNRLGLQTEPSGWVTIKLNVIHQTPSGFKDQESKLDLLEKMSSATILKSVQAVIEAFNRARNRAIVVKDNSIVNKEPYFL